MKTVYMVQTGGAYGDGSYVREVEVKTDSSDMKFILQWLEDGQEIAVTYRRGNGKDIYPRYSVVFPPGIVDVDIIKGGTETFKILSVYMEVREP